MDACVGVFLHELLKEIEEAEDPAVVLSLLRTTSSLLSLQYPEATKNGKLLADSTPRHILELAERCKSAAKAEAPCEESAASGAIRRTFFHASHFKPFAIALLYEVAPDWLACFPRDDMGPCFEAFFSEAPAATVLEVLLPIVAVSRRDAVAAALPQVSAEAHEAATWHAERLLSARLVGRCTPRSGTGRAGPGKPASADIRVKHGGPRRCQVEGCTSIEVGSTQFCRKHEGLRRCHVEGCDSSAKGSTGFCGKHEGARRCQMEGCDRTGKISSSSCDKHHGGLRHGQDEDCADTTVGSADSFVKQRGEERCKVRGCTDEQKLPASSGVQEIALQGWKSVGDRRVPGGLAALLVSVPDRVQRGAPASLRAPKFFISVVRQLLAAAVLEHRPLARASDVTGSSSPVSHNGCRDEAASKHAAEEDNGRNWTVAFVAEVFTRLSRRGHAEIVAAGMIDAFLSERSHVDCNGAAWGEAADVAATRASRCDEEDARWQDLVASISDHAAIERLAEALIRGMAGRRLMNKQAMALLRTFFGKVLCTNSLVRSIFSERLLLHTVLPMPCLGWLVELAQSSSAAPATESTRSSPSVPVADSARNHVTPEDLGGARGPQGNDLLLQMLSCTLAAWATPEFVRAKSLDQQSYVSAALIMSVRRIGQAQLNSTPHVMKDFLEGTSLHLQSPLPAIRKMGQRVAEAFSFVIDPSKPLLFDEEDEQHHTVSNQQSGGPWSGAWWDRHMAPQTLNREEDEYPERMDWDAQWKEGGSREGEGTSPRSEGERPGMELEDRGKERRKERRRLRREKLAAQEEDADEVIVLEETRGWGGASTKGTVDVDSEVDLLDSNDGDSDADVASQSGGSDMSLEPYDLEDSAGEDDEDVRREAPVQLRACAAALRKSDDPETAERALGVVEALVRAGPDELDDWSPELAQALVHMHASTVAVEGEEDLMEQKRHAALVALLVKSTLPSINVLVPQVYSPHVDMSQRLIVIDALADAARELASTPVEPTSDDQPRRVGGPLVEELEFRNAWWGPGQATPPPGAGPWREAATPQGSTALTNWAHKYERDLRPKPGDRKVGHSRRWGRTTRVTESANGAPVEPLTLKNRFAPVAAAFMLPLMRHYDRVSHGVDFLGRDFLVLGRLLWMLGVCMECCSSRPESVPLAESLLDLLLSRAISTHEEPYVRRSALFAASRVLVALPPASVLISLASDDQHGLPASLEVLHLWFTRVADMDPDDECSKMAAACLHLHSEMALKALGTLSTPSSTSGINPTSIKTRLPSPRTGPLIQLL